MKPTELPVLPDGTRVRVATDSRQFMLQRLVKSKGEEVWSSFKYATNLNHLLKIYCEAHVLRSDKDAATLLAELSTTIDKLDELLPSWSITMASGK